MFVEKSTTELAAMTPEQMDAYKADKKAHEEKEVQKRIDEAADKAKAEAFKKVEELETIVKAQGEKLAGGMSFGNASQSAEAIKAELKDLQEKTTKGLVGERIAIKSFTGDDAIAVNDFPSETTGTIAGAIGTIANYFAQVLPGIFKKPIPKSNILDYCDMLPLNANRLVTISENRTVNMAITAEGVEKPVSDTVWEDVNEVANPVASIWKTTTQMRQFFPQFVQSFYNTLVAFMDKIIPEQVISEIKSKGTAFTPIASQVVYDAPNDFDAIVQMIASLVNLGYVPNVAKVSNFTYSALKTLKATDGHYMLANNGSINLLTNEIQFGEVAVKFDTDPSLGADDVIVGDLMAVKVALDSNVAYVEAYEGGDFATNKKSHLLEKFVAVNIPMALRSGVLVDTLSNVKTLITAPPAP